MSKICSIAINNLGNHFIEDLVPLYLKLKLLKYINENISPKYSANEYKSDKYNKILFQISKIIIVDSLI